MCNRAISLRGKDLPLAALLSAFHSRAVNRLAALLVLAPALAFGQAALDAELAATREMVRFKPDDGMAWGAYGKYLYGAGQEAREMNLSELTGGQAGGARDAPGQVEVEKEVLPKRLPGA